MLSFLINPIGAQIPPGELLPRFVGLSRDHDHPTTLHLSYSRWFYRTPPTLIGRLLVQPSPTERLRRPQTGSVRDNRRERRREDENHLLIEATPLAVNVQLDPQISTSHPVPAHVKRLITRHKVACFVLVECPSNAEIPQIPGHFVRKVIAQSQSCLGKGAAEGWPAPAPRDSELDLTLQID